MNTADEKLDVLRESEGLKNAVDSAEQVTQKVEMRYLVESVSSLIKKIVQLPIRVYRRMKNKL